jgi:hypothetical protein
MTGTWSSPDSGGVLVLAVHAATVVVTGVDPAALVDAINTAQGDRVAAKAELDNLPGRSARRTGSPGRFRADSRGCVLTLADEPVGA